MARIEGECPKPVVNFPESVKIYPRATIEEKPYRTVEPGMPIAITISPPSRIGSPPWRKEEYK